MEKSTYYISLDVHSAVAQEALFVMRGDTARRLVISLEEDGKPFLIPQSATVMFYESISKDGNVDRQCKVEDGRIIYEFSTATTAKVGAFRCEVRVWETDEKGDKRIITSPAFELIVSDTLYHDGDIVVDDEDLGIVDSLIAEFTAIREQVLNGEFNGKDGKNGSKWFVGTLVSGDGSPMMGTLGEVSGDFFLNTDSWDVYRAGTNRWSLIGNIKGDKGDKGDPGMTEAEIKSYIDEAILNGEW